MKHKHLKDVATLSLSPDKCVGCGKCAEVCPHDVFKVENGKASIFDKNSCMECGACAKNCPAGAVSVNAGVGCAYAVLWGWMTGNEPSCGCGGGACCQG